MFEQNKEDIAFYFDIYPMINPATQSTEAYGLAVYDCRRKEYVGRDFLPLIGEKNWLFFSDEDNAKEGMSVFWEILYRIKHPVKHKKIPNFHFKIFSLVDDEGLVPNYGLAIYDCNRNNYVGLKILGLTPTDKGSKGYPLLIFPDMDEAKKSVKVISEFVPRACSHAKNFKYCREYRALTWRNNEIEIA